MRPRMWMLCVALLALGATFSTAQTGGPTYVVLTTSLPGGNVGVAYTPQLLEASVGYEGPNQWSIVAGRLPPGLTIGNAPGEGGYPDPYTTIISGTPTTPGLFNFTVQAYQAGQPPLYATQALSIYITGPLTITTPSLPAGAVGVPYSQTFTAAGGPSGGGTQSWSLIGGTLPTGLALSLNGTLAGTPTTAGSYPFTIQVLSSSSDGGSTVAFKAFTLDIAAPSPPVTITTGSTLPAGTVGAAYLQQMAASGGTPPYTWAVASGALPAGINLNTTSGQLSGTPSTAGTYTFKLSATDQNGSSGTNTFTLTVSGTLAITTDAVLPAGAIGTPYSATLAAAGGQAPYAWSILPQSGTSAPPGFVLDPASGRLSGTPAAAGNYQFLAGVSDAAGHTASKLLTLTIGAVLKISTPSPLPGGTVGVAYKLQFSATGGTPPYTWSVANGALPAGLALDPSSGTLSGTPTAGGPFIITIGVKDAAQSASNSFSLTIGAPTLPAVTITGLPDSATPATQPSLGVGLSSAYTLDLTGQATMTFAPDSGADDPTVQFTSGGRNAAFQIPAGATQAVFGSSALGLQTGTVAGTITVTLRIIAAGADVTPTPAPTKVLRIPGAAPVIVSAKLVSNSTGFDLVVTGYSTTREVTGAAVHLVPASGEKLMDSDFTIALTSAFTAWYQSAASAQYGSQFTLDIPFTVQNASTTIGSLTVTLTNSQGTSAASNATF